MMRIPTLDDQMPAKSATSSFGGNSYHVYLHDLPIAKDKVRTRASSIEIDGDNDAGRNQRVYL